MAPKLTESWSRKYLTFDQEKRAAIFTVFTPPSILKPYSSWLYDWEKAGKTTYSGSPARTNGWKNDREVFCARVTSYPSYLMTQLLNSVGGVNGGHELGAVAQMHFLTMSAIRDNI